jgi:hypothetical protein
VTFIGRRAGLCPRPLAGVSVLPDDSGGQCRLPFRLPRRPVGTKRSASPRLAWVIRGWHELPTGWCASVAGVPCPSLHRGLRVPRSSSINQLRSSRAMGRLSYRKHHAKVIAEDAAGNGAARTRSFGVLRGPGPPSCPYPPERAEGEPLGPSQTAPCLVSAYVPVTV